MNFKFIIIYTVVFAVSSTISNFFHKKLQESEGKKVNYDCLKCTAWDCPAKQCIKKKRV